MDRKAIAKTRLAHLGGGNESNFAPQEQKAYWATNQYQAPAPPPKPAASLSLAAPQALADEIPRALLRGQRLDNLADQTAELELIKEAFVPKGRGFVLHSSSKKMGVITRDASKGGRVFIGKRTVKQGECMGKWDMDGAYEVVEGPRRVWLFNARIRFMDKYVANSHQFLVIQCQDGSKEHRRGPTSLFKDPLKHVSIDVLDAICIDAYEVIVVYTEDKVGNVQRSIVRGPTVFVPAVNQWLHVFKWHGSVSNNQYEKVPNALVFTKLATIPDQFYYNAEGVRTSDDASLTIKVMVFFALTDLETMLNSTHDPIGDFINALLADLMNFGAAHTYQTFVDAAQHLSELSSYPVLTSRASAIGYKISKVVYRGYTTNSALQDLCDRAIRARMELRLKQEEQDNELKLQERALANSIARGAEEREVSDARAAHDLKQKAAAHAAELERQKAIQEQTLAHAEAERKAKVAHEEATSQSTLKYLKGLKELGVDLTPTIVHALEPKPNRVIQMLGLPPGTAVHTSV